MEAQGSLSIGSTITLHCSVTPRPHSPVTYTWGTSVGRIPYTSTHAFSPDATLVIHSSDTKLGHCYCTVKVNGATIGTGVTRLEVDSNIV